MDYPPLFERLLKLLDEAEQLASEYSGGYSSQFGSAEEFHQALLFSINEFKGGDRSQLQKLHLWFLPTSAWDDFIGKEGEEIANKISGMLSKLM